MSDVLQFTTSRFGVPPMHRKLFIALGLCLITGVTSTVFGQSTEKEGAGDRRGRSGPGGRDSGSREGGGSRRNRGGESRGADPRSAAPETPGKTDASGAPVRRVAGRVSNIKTAAALALPSQYVAKDTNKDGQIGMYEWSKTDLSTFRKLDLNGDGFLIPSEFASPGTRSTTPATTPAATPVAATAATSPANSVNTEDSEAQPTDVSTPVTTPPAVATVTTSTPPSDPVLAEVEKNFVKWDKNQNGQIEQDEFDGVMRLERVFEKANMKFQGPMPKDKFLETYLQALKTKSTKST
jgi:hypothetical protein